MMRSELHRMTRSPLGGQAHSTGQLSLLTLTIHIQTKQPVTPATVRMRMIYLPNPSRFSDILWERNAGGLIRTYVNTMLIRTRLRSFSRSGLDLYDAQVFTASS